MKAASRFRGLPVVTCRYSYNPAAIRLSGWKPEWAVLASFIPDVHRPSPEEVAVQLVCGGQFFPVHDRVVDIPDFRKGPGDLGFSWARVR